MTYSCQIHLLKTAHRRRFIVVTVYYVMRFHNCLLVWKKVTKHDILPTPFRDKSFSLWLNKISSDFALGPAFLFRRPSVLTAKALPVSIIWHTVQTYADMNLWNNSIYWINYLLNISVHSDFKILGN